MVRPPWPPAPPAPDLKSGYFLKFLLFIYFFIIIIYLLAAVTLSRQEIYFTPQGSEDRERERGCQGNGPPEWLSELFNYSGPPLLSISEDSTGTTEAIEG